jgi:predicted HicB family RNase H-like nuclease
MSAIMAEHGWITVRLDARDKHDLRVIAAKRDLSANELIRQLIRREIDMCGKSDTEPPPHE